jgi:hypothetical protein
MDLKLQARANWDGNLGGATAADNLAAELTEAAFRWPSGMGSAGNGSN